LDLQLEVGRARPARYSQGDFCDSANPQHFGTNQGARILLAIRIAELQRYQPIMSTIPKLGLPVRFPPTQIAFGNRPWR